VTAVDTSPHLAPPAAIAPTVRSVLYVLKRYPRLSETFVVREILGLEAAGVRVHVVALGSAEETLRHPEVDLVRAPVLRLPRHPRAADPTVLRAHLRMLRTAPRRWLAAWRAAGRDGSWRTLHHSVLVAAYARTVRPDCLHAHFATAASDVAAGASRLGGVPWTVTAHAKDIFHVDHADTFPQRVGEAAAVVTVSEHNVDHIRAVTGRDRCTVRHVPNAVAEQEPVAAAPGGSVLCVARLVEKKGIDTLVDAAALLAVDRPDVRVEVVGDGPLRDDLADRIRRLGLERVVHLRGALRSDEVRSCYARASMLVMPCRVAASGDRDGLPTVILEAMAMGLPVVSTDTVGIGETVHHGRTGLLVPPDDAAALAVAIASLLDDPSTAAHYGAAGRVHVRHVHRPERSAQQLIAVWTDVVGGAR
jgi:glycosyltransferase involved in cell wall biosynthesis